MVDADTPMKLAISENEIAEGKSDREKPVPIQMTYPEKKAHRNQWRKFRERTSQLEKHIGQTFSLILDQCTQLLQDKRKQETVWNEVIISYEPI